MTDIYVPTAQDHDQEAENRMQAAGGDADLRDPWFHTEDGKAWLAEQREAAGDPGLAEF